jgi:hypothetical protein
VSSTIKSILELVLFLCDIYNRTKRLDSVASGRMKCVSSISLKPGTDGNVFAAAYDDNLRIFDIRNSTSSKLIVSFSVIILMFYD